MFPALLREDDPMIFYEFRRQSVNAHLEAEGLRLQLTVRSDMTWLEFYSEVTRRLAEGPHYYQLLPPSIYSGVPEEDLGAHLLAFRHTGRPIALEHNGSQRCRQFQFYPPFPGMNLGHIYGDRRRFALRDLVVRDQHFEIFMMVKRSPLQKIHGSLVLEHTCVSERFYALFHRDDSGMTDDDNDESFPPRAMPSPGPSAGNRAPLDRQTVVVDLSSLRRSAVRRAPPAPPPSVASPAALQAASTLPPSGTQYAAAIWQESSPWSPIPSDGLIECDDLGDFAAQVFAAVDNNQNAPQRLRVRGPDMPQLVENFLTILGDAAMSQNFNTVLAVDRGFYLTRASTATLSMGDGIERETISGALTKLLSPPLRSYFLAGGPDNVYHLNASALAHLGDSSRARQFATLGALCGMALLFAIPLPPLDPLFLDVLIHDANIHCITRDKLKLWHPELYDSLDKLKTIGASGDIPVDATLQYHLAEYGDTDATSLRVSRRTEAEHEGLISMMLSRAIMGKETLQHPDIRAFQKGFSLPCPNGFTLPKAIRCFPGGSDAFLSEIWANRISSYSSIAAEILFQVQASVNEQHRMVKLTPQSNPVHLREVLVNFLKGSGVPTSKQEEFQESRTNGALAACSIDLDDIDSPGFRSRAFHLAATGSPTLQTGSKIRVRKFMLIASLS
ncbi:hypothetical protein FA95DRAFT_1612451 [Auriscalpium vulgare]|uniref:Uncharacterized protein n=1 Tax=Auriscalpium vulgare TaxID=40419 RepID=A0ACB8R626_9AGAM|nr:hypothetical protein FA95DRAFT_1612451 [Auriscalpium vulgare]